MMEANNLEGALIDTQRALDKVKLQQKYQKISSEVFDTLNRLRMELSKHVVNDDDHYQTIPDERISMRHHAETTDLWLDDFVQ